MPQPESPILQKTILPGINISKSAYAPTAHTDSTQTVKAALRHFLNLLPDSLGQEQAEALSRTLGIFLEAESFERAVLDAQTEQKPITLTHFSPVAGSESSTLQEFSGSFYSPLHWDSSREIVPYEVTLHFSRVRSEMVVELHSPTSDTAYTIDLQNRTFASRY